MNFKKGDVVKDKVSGQVYIVLKKKEQENKEPTTPLGKLSSMFQTEEKEDIFCKRMKDGLKGWKYSAELSLVRREP
jgi:hypothetical protein